MLSRSVAIRVYSTYIVISNGRRVLDAMFYYQSYASERTRFQGVINDLDKSTGRYRDDINLKVILVCFLKGQ